MSRQGLMDDTGSHAVDYDPPCEKCKYAGIEDVNGTNWFQCLASNGICDFEEEDPEDCTEEWNKYYYDSRL